MARRLLARVCRKAATPDSTTTAILAPSTPCQALDGSSSAATFQKPVTTRTANAGQAIRLNCRAASRAASGVRLSTGTSAARVICPPTQIGGAEDVQGQTNGV